MIKDRHTILKKQIRMSIDRLIKACKRSPNTEVVKFLAKIKENMEFLDIAALEDLKNDKNALNKKMKECNKVKVETGKVFTTIKNYQIDLEDINVNLQREKVMLNYYLEDVEALADQSPEGAKWGEIKALIEQNTLLADQWIQTNKRTIDKLSNAVNMFITTFKQYMDKIKELQRSVYQ